MRFVAQRKLLRDETQVKSGAQSPSCNARSGGPMAKRPALDRGPGASMERAPFYIDGGARLAQAMIMSAFAGDAVTRTAYLPDVGV